MTHSPSSKFPYLKQPEPELAGLRFDQDELQNDLELQLLYNVLELTKPATFFRPNQSYPLPDSSLPPPSSTSQANHNFMDLSTQKPCQLQELKQHDLETLAKSCCTKINEISNNLRLSENKNLWN